MRSRILGLMVTFVVVVAGTTGCKKSSTPSTPSGGAPKDASVVIPRSDGYNANGASAFSPGNLVVPVGTTVVWTNQDVSAHRVTSDTKLFDGGAAPNDSYSRQFTTKGSFSYHCSTHPTMTGTINVQ